MDLDLSGRHALVCGASEGIGLAAAQELALLGQSAPGKIGQARHRVPLFLQ